MLLAVATIVGVGIHPTSHGTGFEALAADRTDKAETAKFNSDPFTVMPAGGIRLGAEAFFRKSGQPYEATAASPNLGPCEVTKLQGSLSYFGGGADGVCAALADIIIDTGNGNFEQTIIIKYVAPVGQRGGANKEVSYVYDPPIPCPNGRITLHVGEWGGGLRDWECQLRFEIKPLPARR
jgi:hypothetical protein